MKTIALPDGQTAIMFTENPSKQLGIVDVATVKRLAQLLPSAPFWKIRDAFLEEVRSTASLEQYIAVIANEFNFHTTVNLLKEWTPEQQENTLISKES